MSRCLCALVLLAMLAPLGCNGITDASPVLLSANVVDPQDVNAFSQFHSCVGHAYPQPDSPNSGKNYFWPNSTNFSSNALLKLFAACTGKLGQNGDDTNDPREFVQGESVHLWCDGSSTAIRFFHINVTPRLLGQHVSAGDVIGYASLLGAGDPPASEWKYSENFDISVVDGDDSKAENYFSKLDAAAFAAWSARGITSVDQTIAPPRVCTSYSSNVGNFGIVVLTPPR